MIALYYLLLIGIIESEKINAIENIEQQIKHLLESLATLPNTKIQYYISGMVLMTHSGASYLSEPKTKSRIAGVLFRQQTTKRQTIKLNSNILMICGVLKVVVALAAEAELSVLFMNEKEVKSIRLILQKMRHP